MAAQSQVTCCNLALLSIGGRAQVSSINPSDGSTQADACSTLYSFVFQQLARTARWGCLNKQTNLTMIQAAQGTPENPTGASLPLPQQPWLYGYLYPPDCLLMRQILPQVTSSGSAINQTSLANSVTPWLGQSFQIPYETSYATDNLGNPLEVILTNQESAVANYTVDQENPQSWDALFTSAFVASLGAYLAPALTGDKALAQMQIKIAEQLIATARAMDSNENPLNQDFIPDWITARGGATGVLMGGVGYAGYGSMNWPGY